MENEYWKDLNIEGGWYQISNLGRMRKNTLLHPFVDKKGYHRVYIRRSNLKGLEPILSVLKRNFKWLLKKIRFCARIQVWTVDWFKLLFQQLPYACRR